MNTRIKHFIILLLLCGIAASGFSQTEDSQVKEEKIQEQDTMNAALELPVEVSTEEMPVYPGGHDALLKFIKENTKYPQLAKDNGIEGKVYVEYTVGIEGKVKDAKVVRGIDPLIDVEALRVINLLQYTTPGKKNGKPIEIKFTSFVRFGLY